MKVSVVIPCYNEEKTIRKIVDRVKSSPVRLHEIIIVDDCSRDGSRDLLKQWEGDPVVRLFYHEVNQGKGAALRTGFKQVMMGSGSWCRSVGHYTFNESRFKDETALKAFVDKLHAAGIKVGMHCFASPWDVPWNSSRS